MILIKAGMLIDGVNTIPLSQMGVLIDGKWIKKVAPLDQIELQDGLEVLDASDMTVMPGMVDCHVHVHTPGGPDENYSINALKELQGTLALRAYSFVLNDLRMGFTTLTIPFFTVLCRCGIEKRH